MANANLTDGGVLDAETLNTFYEKALASTPYTSTGFNASRTGSTGTDTNNTTLSCAAGEIERYVKIMITYTASATTTSSGNSASSSIKIETAENGGGFTTRLDKTVANAAGESCQSASTATIVFYYAPTTDEKANGLDVKITGTSNVTYSAGTASTNITNVQTVILGI